MLYGDDREADPVADIIRAVERGDIEVAVVWGPLAGWHAARSTVPLSLEPVTPWMDSGRWPMVFDISVAVAKDNQELRRELDLGLARNRSSISNIVEAFHVPLAPGG
jgi:mxaJ protein